MPRQSRILALLLALTLAAPVAHAERMGLFVPAYQYPTLGDLWARLTAAAAQLPVTAIADPANGPGDVVDPSYSSVITALRAGGGKVLGYVSTHYATRDTALVIADAERFAAFYPLDGFFLDEMTSDAAHVPYYAAVSLRLHQAHPSFRLVANPGTTCDEGYLSATNLDAVVTFENQTGYPEAAPAAWTHAYAPSRFVNLLYRVNASAMAAAVSLARERHVANVYVTDDSLPNPWDTLPPYMDQEVALLAGLTVGPAPASVAPAAPGAGLRALSAPARGGTAFACEVQSSARALTIFDPQGRAVRQLAVAPMQSRALWDGRDDSGRSVPAGVYLARLGSSAATLRVVLLR